MNLGLEGPPPIKTAKQSSCYVLVEKHALLFTNLVIAEVSGTKRLPKQTATDDTIIFHILSH